MMSITHKMLDTVRHIKNLYFNERVKMNVARFKKSKTKKPKNIIKKEMDELKEYWGCIPSQYITHDFFDKDCNLSIDEMKDYIPGYYFYYIIYPKYDDVKSVIPIVEDKIKSCKLFMELGYRTVEPLILLNKSTYTMSANGELLNTPLEEWLSSIVSNKIFIKPIHGRGGKGIYIAHEDDGNFYVNGTIVDLNYIASLNGDYVIEPGITQCEYMSDIYPNSVNTLRVITKRDIQTNEISIVAITLRMGCFGREVDNGSQGGLLLGIDINAGTPIYPYAVFEYGSEKFEHHPDTGYSFSKFQINDWGEIKRQLIMYAERLRVLNLAGWDIAITDDGPMVIEVNAQMGLDHSQSGVGGLRNMFLDDVPTLP